jgi:hypothetical protein
VSPRFSVKHLPYKISINIFFEKKKPFFFSVQDVTC